MAMYDYEFTDLYVPAFSTNGNSAKSDPLPVEDFTFGYEKIDFEYSEEALFFASGEDRDTDPMAGLLLPAVQAVMIGVNDEELTPTVWYDL